ncbi:MAG TPA: EamA family transporter [Mycobacteriales bacterium]|nr:EamA family transporter [Mycobacteriales bacterium]
MGVLLALLSSALWGWSDFMGGTLARRLPAATVVAVSQSAALLALVPLVLTLGAAPSSWLPGLAAGLAGAVGLGAFYAALAAGTMGVVAPLAATGAVVPVVVGLVRGEQPGALQAAGIVLALVGVVLASGPELSGGAPLRPLLLAALAAACFGTVMVLLAKGSEGPAGAVLVTMLALRLTEVGAVLPLAARARGGVPWRPLLPLLVLLGLVDVLANTAFAFATRSGLLSVVAVLGSLYPVITVLLARQVHAERLQRVQAAGVVATLAGVVLISAG